MVGSLGIVCSWWYHLMSTFGACTCGTCAWHWFAGVLWNYFVSGISNLCLPDESSSFTFRILFIKFILMDYYCFGQVIGACILLVSNWGIIYSLGMALSIRLEVFSGQELESAFFVLCFGTSSVALKFNISSFCLPMLRNYLDIIFVTFCLQWMLNRSITVILDKCVERVSRRMVNILYWCCPFSEYLVEKNLILDHCNPQPKHNKVLFHTFGKNWLASWSLMEVPYSHKSITH